MSENLTTIIAAGLNNPDCAFYTGQMFGQLMVFRTVGAIIALGFLYRAIDKLAAEPLFSWLKKKVYRKKEQP